MKRIRRPALRGRGNSMLVVSSHYARDFSLAKRFRIKERGRIELRLDAFNAFNRTQFDNVNSTLAVRSLTDPAQTNLPFDANGNLVNKNGFGMVSSVRPARNMQLSLHVEF